VNVTGIYGYGKIGRIVQRATREFIARNVDYPKPLDNIEELNTNCLVEAYKELQRKLKPDTFKRVSSKKSITM
jgi:hypothetical protein